MTSDPNVPRSDEPSIIIGGGISGLAAAYYLAKQNRPSILIEAEPRLGGVIQTRTLDGCLLEGGPDSFLSTKPEAFELIKDLGLEQEVIGSNDHQRATWIYRNGRMVPMPDGMMMMVPTRVMPLVTSPLLSWGTKLRMGWELLRKPAPGLPDRSVGEFIENHYGLEAVEYLAEPLLSGVYGGDPYRLSVQSVLPRFADMEARYGSLTKGTLAGLSKSPAAGGSIFKTLQRGLGSLVEAVVRASAGHCQIVRARAVGIVPNRSETPRYLVQTTSGEFAASHVIVATPAWAAADLLSSFDAELASFLQKIPYSSSLTAGLVYDRAEVTRRFRAFGFLVPRVERQALVACTFVDQKFDHRVPPNRLLLRCFLGGAGNEAVVAGAEEDVKQAIQADLARLLGLHDRPISFELSRWPRSMAQYEIGHRQNIQNLEGSLKRYPLLNLVGNAYQGIGISDCIRSGKQATVIFQK